MRDALDARFRALPSEPLDLGTGYLRTSESILVGYFFYTAILAALLPIAPDLRLQIWLASGLAHLCIFTAWLAAQLRIPGTSYVRDWLPVSLALLAYRQSGWFVTTGYENWNGVFEQWDKLLFSRGFGRIIESAGSTLPWVLEASYLFVYAVGPVGILILYFTKRRPAVDILLSCYLFGLLASYGQFAFWPSNPPRIAFPGDFGPMESWLREINLLIVGGFGIHTSVFPSAHVSGAVAAIFGVGRIFGWKSLWTHGFVAYAALVASATVYGRYHYAVDAAAGIAVGVVGGVLALRLLRWGYRLSPEVGATRDAACSSAA